MEAFNLIFWVLLAIVFYTYIGYGLVLFVLVKIKNRFKKEGTGQPKVYEPEVTILIAAYNEKDFVHQKVKNTRELNYPSQKLHQIWVTDGSDDGTPKMLWDHYPEINLLHLPERKGKIAAMNRGMAHVKTPIVVFSDANTLLGKNSIRLIVEMFRDPKVGCTSGEKRIMNSEKESAASAGEGLYWKYESKLKKWDAELHSTVGTAGELFAIRTDLFQAVEPDTILDDFMISLRIAMKGYTIQYNPDAYAMETSSADVTEELKRKIRIAAGGIQSVLRLLPLLNIFKYKLLSFQYISHRVLRWTITPLLLPCLLIMNVWLINQGEIYKILMILQLIFYISAFMGWIIESVKIQFKLFFAPYYFVMMNYAVYRGFFRYLGKGQSVNWARAKRA
jgi:cellulose synthase/poly-beta-1,6-N-acetylglucosamine synthase-like glycosyltransferase